MIKVKLFVPKSLTLIMNDVDCQNFSMNLGVVSPGRHIESQQTLSVVVLSFTSAVRPFDVPASMYMQDFHVFLNFSLPVHSGNVSIIFEVQDSGHSSWRYRSNASSDNHLVFSIPKVSECTDISEFRFHCSLSWRFVSK